MNYQAKKFDHLIGLEGFSEKSLSNHFILYQGYAANVNKLSDVLAKAREEDKLNDPQYAELKRRFGWEFNGMRLHEYYFENLTKKSQKMNKSSKLSSAMVKEFRSYEAWEKDFKSTGVMRGIGWAILCYDKDSGRLFNVWINEHDVGHLLGVQPILVMDVFEHAFMLDYGVKKADYVESFFKVIDWGVAGLRYERAK